MAGDKAVLGTHKHRGFVLDGLDSGLRHGDLGLVGVGGHLHGHKQARAPGVVRVGDRYAHGGGARLLTEQVAHIGHGAQHFGAHFRRADFHWFAHANLVQVLGKYAEGDPHLGQIREGKGIAGFTDHLAHPQVFFHHHTGEGRTQFITIAAGQYRAAAERSHFLPRIVQGDFGFLQSLPRQQVILFGRNFVLPQLTLALEGGARQFDSALAGGQFAALVGNLLAGDHRQQLTLLHRLAQVDLHRLHHACRTGHDMGGTVFIKTHFARQRQHGADGTRLRLGQLDAGGLNLLLGEFELAFFFLGVGEAGKHQAQGDGERHAMFFVHQETPGKIKSGRGRRKCVRCVPRPRWPGRWPQGIGCGPRSRCAGRRARRGS